VKDIEMAKQLTKRAGMPITLEAAVAEYTARLAAGRTKQASTDNPDNTSHPTADAPDNTQPAVEGERSAENERDVKEAIPNTINTAPEAPAREDGSDSVDYHGAPALENEQGVPPVGTTQDDPGTASRLDVSTEKTAAERQRINRLVKSQGRAKTANELAKQSLAELDALLGLDGRPAKRAAAAAGARAAGGDLGEFDSQVADLVKLAAAEAEEAGTILGAEYAQYYLMAKQAAEEEADAALQAQIAQALESGEITPEELEAALAAEEGGGEVPPEEAGMAGGIPGGPGGEAGGELPPEDIGALMDVAQGGGEGGGVEGGEGEAVEPEEGAMAVSDALDGLDLTPEQLMELEAALQEESGAPADVQAEELGKVASVLGQVYRYRDLERVGALSKRASAKRTLLTAQIQQEIMAKTAYMRNCLAARLQAGRRAVAAR
jgi:hypothetical protein